MDPMPQPTAPDDDPADVHVGALRASVDRLRALTSDLGATQLARRAYPSEWTVADVLSHLGSAAVITLRRLEDALARRDTPADVAPGVWEVWNAKAPLAQRDDALAADGDLLARIEAVPAEQRRAFTSTMGPLTLDFAGFVGMRLNEHALHTWDVEVVDDPGATIPVQAAALVVDNLELIARFTAKPSDSGRLVVATTNPRRAFAIDLTPASVRFAPAPAATTLADVELPAEAFIRLVYGRLDPDHTPPTAHGAAVDSLRRVFPGP